MGMRRKPKGADRVVARLERHGARFRVCDRWPSFSTLDPGRSVNGELRVFCGVQHVGWLVPELDGTGWRWVYTRALSGPRTGRTVHPTVDAALRSLADTTWGRRIAHTERRISW